MNTEIRTKSIWRRKVHPDELLRNSAALLLGTALFSTREALMQTELCAIGLWAALLAVLYRQESRPVPTRWMAITSVVSLAAFVVVTWMRGR